MTGDPWIPFGARDGVPGFQISRGKSGWTILERICERTLELAKVWDLCKHLPLPVIVVGLRYCRDDPGDARIPIRQLKKPDVITARAKGSGELNILLKYPLRFALDRLASTILYIFPATVSGETITGVVINLPTIGPLLLRALLAQDMYLAGSLIMFLTTMTVIGMFVSEILLAWPDPRIRYA